MKIAFVGKGGSGKTTLASLTARKAAERGIVVTAIDADINQHLAESIGFTKNQITHVTPLGEHQDSLKSLLVGTNPRIGKPENMIKTTPPGAGSSLINSPEAVKKLADTFGVSANGITLYEAGSFTSDDLGVKCYHSKTGAVELLLNHYVDSENELVVVDMTAGADTFASGMFTRFDTTFIVVEPSIKSISVYNQYISYAQQFKIKISVIANKIEDEDDKQFIETHIPANQIIAYMPRSKFIRQIERGEQVAIQNLSNEESVAVDAIINNALSQKTDWNNYFDIACEFHRKNALAWANKQMGFDVTKQIDPNFSYTST